MDQKGEPLKNQGIKNIHAEYLNERQEQKEKIYARRNNLWQMMLLTQLLSF